MQLKLIPFLSAALLVGTCSAESLSFAPLPMENPESVVGQWAPLLTYIEQSLGVSVRIEYSTSYREILDKFKAGKIDLAYLGPLPYVTLKEKYAPTTPIVHFNEKNGKPTYTCAIVAPADAKFALKDGKGKKIALTQALSTCGYLSTDGLLRQSGSRLEKNKYRYLGAHDEVALAVIRGEFDAGGLKTAIGRKYAHLGLAVIAETDPLPGFALIANATKLKGERIAQIQQALISADADLRSRWGESIRFGVVPARDGDYDAVRKLRARADIPERDNF